MTEDCVPLEHQLVVGAVDAVVPFAVPHTAAVPASFALPHATLEVPFTQFQVAVVSPNADV